MDSGGGERPVMRDERTAGRDGRSSSRGRLCGFAAAAPGGAGNCAIV